MLFPTLDFALFFVVIFAASWSLARSINGRKLFLLGASYFFYGYWDWRFMLLLAGSSLINYWAGQALSLEYEMKRRKHIVAIGVSLNLLVLGFFKYYGFFLDSLADILFELGIERDLPFLEIILPVGISFFTFQGISYIVDVYRRDVPPVSNPVDLFLFISFFPQLVAGPIVRAAHFLPQLRSEPSLDPKTAGFGLSLILFGLFKKMVIAYHLSEGIVDRVFADPWSYSGADLLLGVYAYAVQIYCDFSGYSDIAIGTAALLGFRFVRNFDQPYRATSIIDFWRRWHISLSTWLRDYLFIPLGGSRGGWLKTWRNLMLTMVLGGVWHGAAWNFLLWGLYHGVLLVVNRVLRAVRPSRDSDTEFGTGFVANLLSFGDRGNRFISGTVGVVVTFNLVCIGWILFRSQDMESARAYLSGLQDWSEPAYAATPFMAGLVGLSLLSHFLPRNLPEQFGRFLSRFGMVGAMLIFGLGLVFIKAIAPEGVAPFIYFQF